MPMAHRGNRIQLTIRLPVDEYREASVRARARGWSLSDFVGYCVAREIAGKRSTKNPLKLPTTDRVRTQPMPQVAMRDFDDG